MPRGGEGGLGYESSGKPWTGATSVFGHVQTLWVAWWEGGDI